MGQQQLLLIILVTIIVGIATVVAINTFGSAADSANLDAVRQDMVTIASAAQGYYMKPGAMAGGDNSFDGIAWNNLGSVPGEVSSGNLVNANGTYTISADDQTLTITGYPSSASGYSEGETGSASITGEAGPDTYEITISYTGS